MKTETASQIADLLRKLNAASTTHGRILARLQSEGTHTPGRVSCSTKSASVSSRIRLDASFTEAERDAVALHEAARKLDSLLGVKLAKLLVETGAEAPVTAPAPAQAAAAKPAMKKAA